ncbi:MAG: hypothetical protein P4L46_11005 [Fimbriimonas sp.]|nr:hypothetical protein [Fimbriimonas sp.]
MQTVFGDHVNPNSKLFGQQLFKPNQVQERPTSIHLNEDIYVAAIMRGPACYGSKNANL